MTDHQITSLIVKAELGAALTAEEQYILAHELFLAREQLERLLPVGIEPTAPATV